MEIFNIFNIYIPSSNTARNTFANQESPAGLPAGLSWSRRRILEINFSENITELDQALINVQKLMAPAFRFIRIGEDYDDTEVRGGFRENPFDMELGRSISFSQAV